MKKIALLLIISILAMPFTISADDSEKAKVEFAQKKHDFGTIREADGKVRHDFKFVNSGNKPAVILTAVTTCGCTKADYPKHPIQPGDSGVISVSFNPRDYAGEFIKVVTVKTPNQRIKLKISGIVIPKNQ